MHTKINRRQFGIAALATGVGTLITGASPGSNKSPVEKMKPGKALKNKVALNAYSFNIPLRDGRMDLFDLLGFRHSGRQLTTSLKKSFMLKFPIP